MIVNLGFLAFPNGSLVYHMHPDGEADPMARLQVNLKEALSYAAEKYLSYFTICVWFKVTVFSESGGSVISYALSDLHDNDMYVSVYNDRIGAYIHNKHFDLEYKIRPLWWYPLCISGDPFERRLHLGDSHQRLPLSEVPMLTNGSLVIGQDQDSLDGRFTVHQAFIGHISGFTFWAASLTVDQIHLWMTCQPLQITALLEWEDIPWNIHNESGKINCYKSSPCTEKGTMNDQRLFLFANQKYWHSAFRTVKALSLDMMVPQNNKEVSQISEILMKYQNRCDNSYVMGTFVWLGIHMYAEMGKVINVNNNKTITFSAWSKKALLLRQNNGRRYYAMQNISNVWILESFDTRACFIGVQNTQGLLYKLSGSLTSIVSETYFYFILVNCQDAQPCFYNGKDLHIVRDDEEWILLKYDVKILSCRTRDFPFGRQNWITVTGGQVMNLWFSACDVFTCSNGACFDLHQRCNQIYDCSDGYDEEHCHTVEVVSSSGHLIRVPPAVPVILDLQVYLKKFGGVNILAMRLGVDFILDILWKDTRLQYRNLHSDNDYTLVSTKNGEKVWSPSVTVENSPDSKVYSADDIYIHMGSNGSRLEEGKYGCLFCN
ncbi:hypothetical protein SK128_010614 [Halocaridina rubra]|uniref:Pentraxin (PTX) domain-containing protein n=1 Tax=Halocaridina rubra TaxID=373956 RepID=A0AAN8X918_HALRR